MHVEMYVWDSMTLYTGMCTVISSVGMIWRHVNIKHITFFLDYHVMWPSLMACARAHTQRSPPGSGRGSQRTGAKGTFGPEPSGWKAGTRPPSAPDSALLMTRFISRQSEMVIVEVTQYLFLMIQDAFQQHWLTMARA